MHLSFLTNQSNCFQQTVLSDFHLLTVTEFKMGFQNVPPKRVKLSRLEKFSNENFISDISKFDFGAPDREVLRNTIFFIFNKNALIKRKYILTNEASHKTIVKKSNLRNRFRKSEIFSDRKAYTSQHNFCINLLRNTKWTYFNNLDIQKVTDNQSFWRTIAPLFSNPFLRDSKINLTEEDEIISTGSELRRVSSALFTISRGN